MSVKQLNDLINPFSNCSNVSTDVKFRIEINLVTRTEAGARLLQHTNVRVVAQTSLAQTREIRVFPSCVVHFRDYAEALFSHVPAARPAAPSAGSCAERIEQGLSRSAGF